MRYFCIYKYEIFLYLYGLGFINKKTITENEEGILTKLFIYLGCKCP